MTVMQDIRRRARQGLVAGAFVSLALLLAPGLRAEEAGAEKAVNVSVVLVRATAAADPGTKPEVDPALGKLNIPRLRLGYSHYGHEATVEQSLAWGETLSMPFDATKSAGAGGRYTLQPVKLAAPGRVVLHIEETGPGAKDPCLKLDTEVQAGRVHLWFCDDGRPDGTLLFFVTVTPIAK